MSAKKAEIFVACHLLKAGDAWNDMGLSHFELGYLRDKQKPEVDFILAREAEPVNDIETAVGRI